MSLRNNIYEYLRGIYPETAHKGLIGKKAIMDWGSEADTAGRRCRELAEEGIIEIVRDKKGRTMYRWLPEKARSDNPIAQQFLEEFAPKKEVERKELTLL